MELGLWVALVLVAASSLYWSLRGTAFGALLLTIVKLIACKGRRAAGALTGLWFPISVEELTGPRGPKLLTKMLQHGQHLPLDVSVLSVQHLRKDIKDGVKGDKALLKVTFSKEVPNLPETFFVKFNLQSFGAMRLLVATSDVCLCEALFYHHLAEEAAEVVKTPKCFFVDFNRLTGEFCLLTEALHFGGPAAVSTADASASSFELRPMKHRIRDPATLEEQLLFIETGARLHCKFWADNQVLRDMPKFYETHREMWVLCSLSGRFGLGQTVRRTLRGQAEVNEDWMTWDVPGDLKGKEWELINDMPAILTSLAQDLDMAAFGHNDLTTDNAFYWKDCDHLKLGLFDWQQSCVNNVAQEWAWNWHFLEPEFLTEHEERLIGELLVTYERLGRPISRKKFLHAYVLGTVQMFVFGGGGLQLLMAELHSKGIFQSLVPNDPRCRMSDSTMDENLREKLVGAEMTRRTFTNCCNIMRRHDFASAWLRWKAERTKGRKHVQVLMAMTGTFICTCEEEPVPPR
ncbi:unnamed protein product [Durusdinium trenchii]|uniref:Uncharacterized protein n=2 Tax=Durusdinium trenchii TaxID=1381693 RepID=A0ABP0I169_9DINO